MCSIVGLDSQAALHICQLLRRIAQNGLAILCVVNQPSARLLQTFDRLLLLGKGGKQLYFGKIGLSCKTMINYFERNGSRPCNADENPAEWMLDISSSTENSTDSRDLSEIWKKSTECKAVKSKLAHLREKFVVGADPLDGFDTSDAVQKASLEFDAMALQRKSTISALKPSSLAYSDLGAFYKYRCLENMQLPAASPTNPFGSWITNGATFQQPAYLL